MNKTGFGVLRLPRLDPADELSINYEELTRMVDTFMARGGNYFDTAWTYLSGTSEGIFKKVVADRYPRASYRIADKLPGWKITAGENLETYFNEQLNRCGVDYFDVYLIHWLSEAHYRIAEEQDQFALLRKVKAEGRAKAIGFSYHGGHEQLEQILVDHPETDYVQLQINFLDWNSVSLQAKKCYDVAAKYGKKVIVMEPVKGGSLASLPEEAQALLRASDPKLSDAAWAVRFASSLDAVETVLSGMSTLAQVEDNMQAFEPMTQADFDLMEEVAGVLRSKIAVACTGCNYCAPNCPQNIPIPKFFALYNEYERNPKDGWKMQHVYDGLAASFAKASDCIACGNCERNCPQKLPIIENLKKVSATFEK
ncbi:MAG: 4Fe-4S dicluster domain-containing protein [Ruminococcaceae bacterium]|nr:4Fe-4S dicluster domain-containing protein [Oscillospiraceae bacterium]